MLPPGLLVVEDTGGGGKDDVSELTRREQLDDPLLEITELDVVAGVDDTSLVDLCIVSRVRVEERGVHTRPLSWMTILPLRWSSTSSNSPM